MKALKFIIFRPPPANCFTTTVFFIFGFLFHKKSNKLLLINSIVALLGLGSAVNRRLNIGIIKVFITVIFPNV